MPSRTQQSLSENRRRSKCQLVNEAHHAKRSYPCAEDLSTPFEWPLMALHGCPTDCSRMKRYTHSNSNEYSRARLALPLSRDRTGVGRYKTTHVGDTPVVVTR